MGRVAKQDCFGSLAIPMAMCKPISIGIGCRCRVKWGDETMRKYRFTALILILLVVIGTNLVSAANANPEGQIVIVGTDVETLNPMLSESTYESVVLNGIFSQLVRMDEAGNLLPDLAVEVPTVDNGGISADGKVFTFHLRKDAKWHDGKPVTAKDVVFTWEMIMKAPQVVSRDGFSDIERMETPDDYTVVMYLKEQRAAWLLNWAAVSGAIIPAHVWKDVAPTEFTKDHNESDVHPLLR
jgi:peptide/nickel transport system substrate-binding protein